MVQQGDSTYDSKSTEDLFRVARIVTPPEDLNNWVVTAWGRCWYRDGAGDWRSIGGDDDMAGHRYDDEFMRDLLSEQLNAYMVSEANAIWQQH